MPDPRRIARPTSPAQLDAQAATTPGDVERAKVLAEQDGTKTLAAMLNALPFEGQP